MGEHDERVSPARPAGRARDEHRAVQRLLRQGRDAYDVRGRTAHEAMFNTNDGRLPLPEHPAGLLAVHHLDARAGLGDAGLRRTAGVPRERRRLERVPADGPRSFRRSSRGDLRLLHRQHAGRRHSLLGHRRARPGAPAATTSTGRPIRSTSTSRSTARPPRSPRRACCGSAATSSRRRRAALLAGRAHRRSARCSPSRTCPPTRRTGPAAALGLSPAERLGPRAGRPAVPCGESSMWGDYHAPRARPLPSAGGDRRAVLHVLRRRPHEPRRPWSPGRPAGSGGASRSRWRPTGFDVVVNYAEQHGRRGSRRPATSQRQGHRPHVVRADVAIPGTARDWSTRRTRRSAARPPGEQCRRGAGRPGRHPRGERGVVRPAHRRSTSRARTS